MTSSPRAAGTYAERLRVPVPWALAVLVVVLIAAVELDGGHGGWVSVTPYVLVPVSLAVMVALSGAQVRVADGVLHVPGARAPLTAFGHPEVIQGLELRTWLGPKAQVDAWVVLRPWLRSAVRLPVTDPDDDTPYWIIGTRHPVALAAALS